MDKAERGEARIEKQATKLEQDREALSKLEAASTSTVSEGDEIMDLFGERYSVAFLEGVMSAPQWKIHAGKILRQHHAALSNRDKEL